MVARGPVVTLVTQLGQEAALGPHLVAARGRRTVASRGVAPASSGGCPP